MNVCKDYLDAHDKENNCLLEIKGGKIGELPDLSETVKNACNGMVTRKNTMKAEAA